MRKEDKAFLNVSLISTEGDVLLSCQVSEIDPSGRSGFPQITQIDKGVLITWTELNEDSKTVRTVTLF